MEQTKEVVIQTVQLSTISDVLAIILSIVALAITVVGFFASLKFYKDGVELQKSANDALVKLEEKTQSIQMQVGGMFEKTLDAAISSSNQLDQSFDVLDEKLTEAKNNIVEATLKELGQAGNKEKEKLEEAVKSQLRVISESVQNTRESAEEVAYMNSEAILTQSSLQSKIANILIKTQAELSITEIANSIGASYEGVRRAVRRMVDRGMLHEVINEGQGFYRILRKKSA